MGYLPQIKYWIPELLYKSLSEGNCNHMYRLQRPREELAPVVLVVDDNPAIRDMVSWALELDGYDAVEAAEGREALNWIQNAEREGRYPAVILLDLAMPGMDGFTFLKHLQAQWQTSSRPSPAVIVLTASTQVPDAVELGVKQVVEKPFHARDILNLVRQFV
jgi:two-component system chemotaxis response regulator CheY